MALVSKSGNFNTVGGRHSVSGITATVFGATGFLGKYVVSKLGAMGCRLIIPHRGDELYLRPLKVMADLGAMHFYNMSIRSLPEIQSAVEGSNVVINLLGGKLETRRWSFEDVNTSFPSVLGEVCAEQGVSQLVHMSALGASVDSPSKFLRSKALGESGLLDGFPSATIMRPALIFGDEDRLFNQIIKVGRHLPILPLLNGGAALQQPVFCNDVADAIVKAAIDPETKGKTYSLAGPKVASYKDLVDHAYKVICEAPVGVTMPETFGMAFAGAVEQIPNPWLTRDELRRQQLLDNIMPEGDLGLQELGITPTPYEFITERYLLMYRKENNLVDEEAGVIHRSPHT